MPVPTHLKGFQSTIVEYYLASCYLLAAGIKLHVGGWKLVQLWERERERESKGGYRVREAARASHRGDRKSSAAAGAVASWGWRFCASSCNITTKMGEAEVEREREREEDKIEIPLSLSLQLSVSSDAGNIASCSLGRKIPPPFLLCWARWLACIQL